MDRNYGISAKYFSILFLIFVILFGSFSTAYATAVPADTPQYPVAVNDRYVAMELAPFISEGRMLVSVRDVFAPLGIKLDWKQDTKEMTFSGVQSQTGAVVKLTMKSGSRIAVLNDVPLMSDASPRLVGKTFMVPVRLVAELFKLDIRWDTASRTVFLTCTTDSAPSRGDDRNFRIVVDPGHGGFETGAVCSGVYEKDLNLDIALRLKSLLARENADIRLTRDRDAYVSLYSRAKYANDVKADLFVSIHNNAGYSRYRGAMTLYYPSVSNTVGKEAASIIQKTMVDALGCDDLGIIPRPNLVVLRETKMPSVITEVAFLTNKADLELLLTEQFRQKAAVALKDSIIAIMDKLLKQ